MTTTPIGDLGHHLQTRARLTRAQSELFRLTGELSSGRKSDLGRALRGDFTGLASIERGLRMASTYQDATGLAGAYFGRMQDALGTIQDQIGTLGPEMMSVAGLGQDANIMTTAIGAEDAFSLAVTALNTQSGGRSPFAGTATNRPALVPAADMLADLETLVAGAADAASMIAIVDDYFMTPAGGYETAAYLGDTAPQTGFTISEGETVSTNVTALDPSLRTAFSGLAIGALMTRGLAPPGSGVKSELALAMGSRLQTGQDEITAIRSGLGVTEARIETAETRHNATVTSLGLERSRLVSADPAATATDLSSTETQLETLYILTARLSRLSLSEYL
ncbi:hypothetical protein HKCCE2091_13570 [Rhodobacterales bacterium HKCCE2091]|nr:hypothetical protein [Rhodobacterales bacterium HKCCE2091]